MAFLLSRGAANVAAEVQRWQYFLWRNGIVAVGAVDGDFGPRTESATRMYQAREGLNVNGKLDGKTLSYAEARGYSVLEDNYYKDRKSPEWPPRPNDLSSPSNEFRNSTFECFEFRKPGAGPEITILGKCSSPDVSWRDANVVRLERTDLGHVAGFPGYFTCHRLAAPRLAVLIDAWAAADLLHLFISYSGMFYPRYKKDQSPAGPHGTKRSVDVTAISNHSFGTAFDINVPENGWAALPAICGSRGSVRELAKVANGLGFFWGGYFNGTKDGMHFEVAK